MQKPVEEFVCSSIEDSEDIDVCKPYNDIKDD